jgi:hypothetical protein
VALFATSSTRVMKYSSQLGRFAAANAGSSFLVLLK